MWRIFRNIYSTNIRKNENIVLFSRFFSRYFNKNITNTLYNISISVWKSHATLTLLATQDCPLWLQYD